jgi:hypothetical protein
MGGFRVGIPIAAAMIAALSMSIAADPINLSVDPAEPSPRGSRRERERRSSEPKAHSHAGEIARKAKAKARREAKRC